MAVAFPGLTLAPSSESGTLIFPLRYCIPPVFRGTRNAHLLDLGMAMEPRLANQDILAIVTGIRWTHDPSAID